MTQPEPSRRSAPRSRGWRTGSRRTAVTCDGAPSPAPSWTRRPTGGPRLRGRGVGVGDYVTIVLPNSIEWIQAAVACWKLGAVPSRCRRGCPTRNLRPAGAETAGASGGTNGSKE
ncbi:AMP-binding enzyme family protein [Mycobacterium xenopi 3993]|nr:AMP-binding enzyme family protein [Mycobacterium xenopi 3993]